MSTVIHMENLTKSYGDILAVSEVNLDVQAGEVFGYLGPYAGKTTTIRVLLDLIRPTSSSVTVFGLDSRLNSRDIRGRVGYLSGEVTMYEKMTGNDLLTYLANLQRNVDWGFVEELSTRLDCNLSQSIRSLSRGNKQKVGLVQAFMHKPELIIMDEPTSGLDPLIQQEFYHMVEEVKTEGRTVFLSSHNLPEVERVCDRVAIIRESKLITVEDVSAVKARALHQLEMHFACPVPPGVFANLPGVRDVTVEDTVLSCTVMGTVDALIKAAAHFEVVKVVSHEPSGANSLT